MFLFFLQGLFTQPLVASDLSSIRHKIRQQQDKIYKQRQQRNELQSQLKNQEKAMGEVIKALHNTKKSLTEIRQTIKKTELQIEQLEKQEQKQKARLREQLDSAYRSGINPSVIEKLLSKEAKEADRMAQYYEHMNQARIDLINDIRHTQQKLTKQRDLLAKQISDKMSQISEQTSQKQQLEKITSERKQTIFSINKTLKKDSNHLEILKENAKSLQESIANANQEAQRREERELAKLKAEKEQQGKGQLTNQEIEQVRAGSGLGKARRQYAMPTHGKIIQKFDPEHSWKGIVIKASTGDNVRAITSGRVVLANWLPGYGNVVVIDHGKNYSSIYGYNSDILVKENDKVGKGMIIAKVGNSGGQSHSGLYFGITYKGQAKNPLRWVK
ncbi:murein hydrolase activator EnvC [Phocoenobacter uteri]|nr:hypothetical protein [Phocoenobacter uteri]